MLPTPDDLTRRARAAWGYSLLTYEQLGAATGIKPGTLKGLLRGGGGPAPSIEQAALIAEACKVPPRFVTEGFASDEITDLRVVVLQVVADVVRLTRELQELRGTDHRAAP